MSVEKQYVAYAAQLEIEISELKEANDRLTTANAELEANAAKVQGRENFTVPTTIAEFAQAIEWKKSALNVLSDVDFQEIGLLLNVPLGESVSKAILPGISNLVAQNAELTAENESLSESIAAMEKARAEVSAAMQERIDDLEAANAELHKAQHAVARQRIEELEKKNSLMLKYLLLWHNATRAMIEARTSFNNGEDSNASKLYKPIADLLL